MKIIFLDIDGVLNWRGSDDRIDGFIGLDPENIARFNKIIDAHPDAKIVMSSSWRHISAHQTTYKSFDELVALLHARGLRGEFIGHTPIHARGLRGEFIGHTPIFFGHRGRGHEIRAWMDGENNRPEGTIDQFVVLDDDRTGMEPFVEPKRKRRWETDEDYEARLAEPQEIDLRPHHVVTSFNGYAVQTMYGGTELARPGGLQDEHIEQAIRILNGQLLDVKPAVAEEDDPTWE